MPGIVEQEVFDHRAAQVLRAEQQIKQGYAELRRHGGPGFSTAEPVVPEEAIEVAGAFFDTQIDRFVEKFGGERLDASMPGLAQKLFDAYFNGHPPFGAGKDKKSEFPDAAVLLTLEEYAARRGIQLLCVSKDRGWHEFAALSPQLYCVSSLDELTSLFEHTSSEALAVRRKLVAAIEHPESTLRKSIATALQRGISSIHWSVRPWRIFKHQVHLSVVDAEFVHIEPRSDGLALWITSTAIDRCVAEIAVDVTARVRVDGTIESARGVEVASGTALQDQNTEIGVLLECSGDLLSADVATWGISVDLASPTVSLDLGRAPFNPPLSGFLPQFPSSIQILDGFEDDDIPF